MHCVATYRKFNFIPNSICQNPLFNEPFISKSIFDFYSPALTAFHTSAIRIP